MTEPIHCGKQIILADGSLRTVTCQRIENHWGAHVSYVDGDCVTFSLAIDQGEPKSWWGNAQQGILP